VTAIIPARNEAAFVGSTVGSLLAQNYPGRLCVVVVDDHSDDDTAGVAARAASAAAAAARLRVIAAPPLPPGWTGKLWAVAQGVDFANEQAPPPEYVLLTDGDVRYDREVLSALAWNAVEDTRVLSSLMVELRCQSLAERTFIPAFVFFFQMIYPFAWVNDPTHRSAAAAGGCMLVRRQTLADAGGIGAIRSDIIDDCALGRLMKRRGEIHIALGESVQSLRPCPSIAAVRHMVVRTAYAQLNHSPWLLALLVLAMLAVFVAPVVLSVGGEGWTRWLALLTWLLMAMLFAPMTRRYRVSALWGLALPAIATVYLLFTIDSAIQHWLGRGGVWKGRSQGHADAASKVLGP
jgi:hopene-associated glycosyltransferase HpnB